jgi:hypothetical protein
VCAVYQCGAGNGTSRIEVGRVNLSHALGGQGRLGAEATLFVAEVMPWGHCG